MIKITSRLIPALFVMVLTCLDDAGAKPGQNEAKPKSEPARNENASPKIPYDSTDRYQVREIEGWTVLVNKRFLAEQKNLANKTLALLSRQLGQIVAGVSPDVVKALRTIHFWVEENEPHHPCMAYHPNPDWLREHDMNPEKAGCVELSNARHFLDWTEQQPWMVLHELSHGYHHQFLKDGFGNTEIKNGFDAAMNARRYELVQRSNGKREKAYAATNPMEFFAEASEAYFGINDFYPVNRADLRQYDPDTFALVKKLWQDR